MKPRGLLALLAACAALPALAQEAPILVGGQTTKQQPLYLEPVRAAIEAQYWYQSSSISSKSGPKTTFTENYFQETLDASTSGYIWHPNLVDLKLAGEFGLTQDSTQNTGVSQNQDGTILNYDVNATILRKQETPITLYSRQLRQLVTRDFGPAITSINSATGGIVDVKSPTLPSRFEIYHSDENQTAPSDQVGSFDLSQNVFNWHTDWHPTQTHTLNWNYVFDDAQENSSGFGTNQFQTHDAALNDSIDFGADHKSNLNSNGTYFNQSGDFPLERLHWDELLRLHHNDSFETNYEYTLDNQNDINVDQLQQRGRVGFQHWLYKSLITTGHVGLQDQNRSDGSDSFDKFADIDFDYHKNVPYGLFSADLRYAFDQQDNTAQTAVTDVRRQPATFTDPAPITLIGSNINPGSILITDPSGLIIYRPGIDYTVRTFANRIEIDRVVGGRIPNNGAVLLNYERAALPGNTVTTNNFGIGLRYDITQGPLNGLSVYGRYGQQDQSIATADPSAFTPNSYTDIVGGSEYRFWRMTVGYEHEIYDSRISPYNADRVFARYADRLSLDTTIAVNSAYTAMLYTQDHDQVDLLTVSATLDRQLTTTLHANATILFRYEEDSLRGNTIGLEEQVGLTWNIRQTKAYINVRNANLNSDFSDSNFLLFQVGIRRDF